MRETFHSRTIHLLLVCMSICFGWAGSVHGQVAGRSSTADLVIADGGKTAAIVAVAPDAGEWERRAAADLVDYIEKMSGARPKLANTAEAVAQAVKGTAPVLIIGKAALEADPSLSTELVKVAKRDPVLRADAIVLKRSNNIVYLAGTNDDSQYYAVVDLLRRWGCRWYMPGEIGECVPHQPTLKVGDLYDAYAPPFEVRRYWLSWIGDTAGKPEFMRRNYFNEVSVPNGHALAQYTKELIPKGKSMFNVPISEDRTAEHVAAIALKQYAAGKDVMLGMEDGIYESDSAQDKTLVALQYDKYFMVQSYTDAFMILYNKTANILMHAAPDSRAHIGFLIYSNITLPPVKDITAAKPLVGYLAPIDFDPIHGMNDPRSAPRREYKEILYKWAKVMQGRMVIYDYDQSMLVWRDIPNPSHQAFREDVKEYRKAGILGIDTESRGAHATIFLNLFMRGQLQWNTDTDVDALLAEFYPKFYGPAAGPMKEYWTAIYKAWEDTLATEHEYFVAPAIYTPELIAKLRKSLEAAEAAMKPLEANPTPEAKRYLDRMRFTRLGFDVLENYMAMVAAANSEVDYKTAVAAGERGLAAREQLTEMNGTFTTYKKIGEHGPAWWPGEVEQYRDLLAFTEGKKGTLVQKLPLVWNFRRDAKDVGVKEGWEKQPVDLSAWNGLKQPVSIQDRQNISGGWEQIRSDLYIQAQGIVTPDFQSYTGHAWYQTDVDLKAAQTQGPIHLRFPGLFNECWLYVNGINVAHRDYKGVWWMNDYKFEWDVDLAGKLKPGKNSLMLRIFNPHHLGGMFRRPFLYRATVPQADGRMRPPPPGVPTSGTQEQAIAALKKMGANVYLSESDPQRPVESVVLSAGSEWSDAGMANLQVFHQLRYLDASKTAMNDAGLSHFQGLTQLEFLDLQETDVTDAGLKYLKELTRLDTLNLGETKVSDAGIKYLVGLDQLEDLNFEATQIGDASLAQLAGLKKLGWLNLDGTHVTDGGLQHLAGMKNLQWLNLRKTRVTDEGVKAFQKAMQSKRSMLVPDCEIVRKYPGDD